MVVSSFILLFIVLIILIVLGLRKQIINHIKVVQTYRIIPCPSTTLPLLGNVLDLPLNPYSKN